MNAISQGKCGYQDLLPGFVHGVGDRDARDLNTWVLRMTVLLLVFVLIREVKF
jgi:hypothetical protein